MKKKHKIEGTPIPLNFEQKNHPWVTIEVEDGTTIMMKTVVVDVVRIDGKYDETGKPVYAIKSTNIIRVVPAPNLVKQTQTEKEKGGPYV